MGYLALSNRGCLIPGHLRTQRRSRGIGSRMIRMMEDQRGLIYLEATSGLLVGFCRRVGAEALAPRTCWTRLVSGVGVSIMKGVTEYVDTQFEGVNWQLHESKATSQ